MNGGSRRGSGDGTSYGKRGSHAGSAGRIRESVREKKVRSAEPATAGCGRGHSPTRGSWIVAAGVFACFVATGIHYGPSSITGDETEYYATTYAWATDGSPA